MSRSAYPLTSMEESLLGETLRARMSPVVMVISTAGAEAACRSNGLSFVDMLRPHFTFSGLNGLSVGFEVFIRQRFALNPRGPMWSKSRFAIQSSNQYRETELSLSHLLFRGKDEHFYYVVSPVGQCPGLMPRLVFFLVLSACIAVPVRTAGEHSYRLQNFTLRVHYASEIEPVPVEVGEFNLGRFVSWPRGPQKNMAAIWHLCS